MQSHYDECFEREMGCTVAEWVAWLPAAVGVRAIDIDGSSAQVALDRGRLLLQWQTLPARRIGLITLPRLHARFTFEGTSDEDRLRFMRRFDLYMQRGGG